MKLPSFLQGLGLSAGFLMGATATAGTAAAPSVEELSTALRLPFPAPPATRFSSADEPLEEDRALANQVVGRWPQLSFSSALTSAAEAYAAASVAAGDTELPQHFIHAVLSWAGCLEYEATVITVSTSEDSAVDVMDQLSRLVERPGDESFSHVGLARTPVDNPPFRWRWAAVLSRRQIELAGSLSRRHEPNTRPGIRFRLLAPLRNPQLKLILPNGQSADVPLRAADGGWLDATFNTGPGSGTLWLEIYADSPRGPVMVCHLPLDVSTTEASTEPPLWQGWGRPDESFIASAVDAEALMTELLNAERQRYGLPILSTDAVLVSVAREHSTDMRGTGFFGHQSPSRGGLAERLKSAAYAAASARENICRANSVYGAHISLLQSPTHRANMLAADVEAVGVGIAIEHGSGAEPNYVTTQVFATPLRHPSPEQVAEAVAELVQEIREGADPGRLQRLAELDASAQVLSHHVQETGKLDRTRFQLEHADLQTQGFEIRSLNSEILHTSTLDELQLSELVGDDRFTHYGVGAVKHIDGEQRAIFDIVILYAQVKTP